MKKNTTLKDIADYVGVNPATVSRALDPIQRELISLEVRDRIEKAANKFNYRARISGRSLATNKSLSVGLVLHRLEKDLASPFFAVFITSFLMKLHAAGYSMQILPVTNEKTREKEILNYLYSGRVDGFFIGQTLGSNKVLDEIGKREVPFVIFDEDRKIDKRFPCLSVDENFGAEEAVKTLTAKGVSKVAYWHHDYIKTQANRINAFEEAWTQKSTKNIETLIYHATVQGTLSNRHESRREATKHIEKLKKYEAIVCSSDLIALGLIDALIEKNIKPGKDIHIIGYGNIEENSNFFTKTPILSTIDRRYNEGGIIAAEMLLTQMQTGLYSDDRREIPTKFIKRTSTGD